MPKRIQRKRVRGWRMPPDAVYIGRPTKWGNPYKLRPPHDRDRQFLMDLYRSHLLQRPDLMEAAKRELRGKDLACWCPLDQPCHADVLLEIANQEE